MGFEVLLIIFFSFASCKSTLTNSKMSKSKRGTTIYAPLYFLNRWLDSWNFRDCRVPFSVGGIDVLRTDNFWCFWYERCPSFITQLCILSFEGQSESDVLLQISYSSIGAQSCSGGQRRPWCSPPERRPC